MGIEAPVDVSTDKEFHKDLVAAARQVDDAGWQAYQRAANSLFKTEYKKIYALATETVSKEKPELIPFISRMDRDQIEDLKFTLTTKILDFMTQGKNSVINYFGRIPCKINWGF